MKLDEITIYPVKSLSGIQLKQAEVSSAGLSEDRTWMLIDDQSVFISQRKVPLLARISVQQLKPQQWLINSPAMSQLIIDSSQISEELTTARLWKDQCSVIVAKPPVNRWFSQFLEQPVRLVYYDFQNPRKTDPCYSKPKDTVSFADGFPLLLASQSSLDDLNTRLENPVTMTSFRPNVVINSSIAYQEDHWKKIQIGQVAFDVVKPCQRCVLTTVNPVTGVKRADGEPLRALSQYRRGEHGVTFGMNLIPRTPGSISLNDKVTILE